MVYLPISGFTSSKLPCYLPMRRERAGLKLILSKLSSAHVYLRQPESQPHGEWDKLPIALLNDAAQLVKANSIEGESELSYRLSISLDDGLLATWGEACADGKAGNKKDNITVRPSSITA